MANYINRYATLAAYTAEASARDNLGRTVNLVTSDGKLHYDGKLNPLGLPAKTIRCKFTSGYTPSMGTSQTRVDSANNVWDIGFSSADNLFTQNANLLEVICANTSSVTTMKSMFFGCTNLTSVPLFDTSSVTSMYQMFSNCASITSVPHFDTSSVTTMYYMFNECTSLRSVPLFDTSSVSSMTYMFAYCTSITFVPLFDTSSLTTMNNTFLGCSSVTGGALALYQQVSTQTSPPSKHTNTFTNCGENTSTGAAELAQIPSSWGGTGA